MGYDQHQQSNTTGTVIAIVVAVLLLAVLGIVAVVGAGLFYGRTERMAAVEAEQAATVAEIQQATDLLVTQTETVSIEVRLNHRGVANMDGEEVDIDVLRTRLAKLKKETDARLSLRINADAECPVKHVVAILSICEEVGDIDFRIETMAVSDVAAERSNVEE